MSAETGWSRPPRATGPGSLEAAMREAVALLTRGCGREPGWNGDVGLPPGDLGAWPWEADDFGGKE